MPIGTPAAQPAVHHQHQQPKLSIGHEIDKWIASVSCCASLPSNMKTRPNQLGPNRILVDKATLLSFLAKLKMHHQKKREIGIELCAFCRQNQEPFHVYTSHRLADINGNVTCPVLFRYVCPICGVSGSKAHTIKYCPLGNGTNQQQRHRLQSVSGF
uniref:Nanos-type domain-containing protein n=1 Tax=Macrostomum lignano TaxID=282301 RepID=A0A1I8I1Q0_9PLAT